MLFSAVWRLTKVPPKFNIIAQEVISKCCSLLHAGTQKYLLNLNKIDKKKGASPSQLFFSYKLNFTL